MISRHLRFAFLGALMGLVVALVPGCQKKCGPDTCTGCCSADNACVTATDVAACGTAGAACAACGTDQACTDGVCPDFAGDSYLFTGPQSLLGEFGWIAAVTMLLLGLAAGWWHMRHSVGTAGEGTAHQ